MIPVELSKIIINDNTDQQYIYVNEIEGTRGFPIIIGTYEAHEIDRKVRDKSTPRPLTHDLIRLILKGLEAELQKIVVCDLRDGTFYANLYIKQADRELQVDCRPSDAIALATALSVPIFVEEKVMDEVGKLEDDDIACVIITGEGKAFVAGADIKEMLGKNPIEARKFTQLGQDVFRDIENMNKPVIAAVNGFALGGGCELALTCDLIIASENAKFGLPEVGLGIHPGFGGTQRLPRLIGKAKAKELIFTGEMLDAKEAQRIGLVNMVTSSERLLEEVKAIASKIATKAPIAIQLAKSAINKGCDMDLNRGLAYEVESVAMTFSTKDSKEGMKAFTERRKPKFKG